MRAFPPDFDHLDHLGCIGGTGLVDVSPKPEQKLTSTKPIELMELIFQKMKAPTFPDPTRPTKMRTTCSSQALVDVDMNDGDLILDAHFRPDTVDSCM